MNTSETGVEAQSQALTFDFDLGHPPEKVWKAITNPELLSQWLLPAIGFELAPGTEFMFRTAPQPGWDGTVSCRILEIEPQRKLSYTWTVPFLDTVVAFTLSPTDAGTHLRIEQTGFRPEQKRESGGARYGWNMMGGRLTELLERMP